MKLRKFIKKLKEIEKKHGENLEVVMADNIPVVGPIFSDKYLGEKVVITDEK
jgi:chitinase